MAMRERGSVDVGKRSVLRQHRYVRVLEHAPEHAARHPLTKTRMAECAKHKQISTKLPSLPYQSASDDRYVTVKSALMSRHVILRKKTIRIELGHVDIVILPGGELP